MSAGRRARRRFLAGICVFLLAPAFAQAGPVPPVEPVEVESRPLARFRIASDETRFGAFEYAGGFSMRSPSALFGQLSGFRFLTPGGDFVAVADHGYWVFGRIERDSAGRPLGVTDLRMQAMVDAHGRSDGDKDANDAEGLVVHDGVATVSFEHEHRISEYALRPGAMGAPLGHLDFLVPRRELRRNAGFETLVRAPQESALAGARIAIAERSLDPQGDLFAAILEGPQKGIFTVARHDGFDATDGAFLPDGDLLLLERRLSLAGGISMRLRRIEARTIRKGGRADGPVMMEANLLHHVDNMEGLDVWRREDGATMVSVISDDNQSILQRSLYLEFRLVEE